MNPQFKNREEYEKWRQSKSGKGIASAGRKLETRAQKPETATNLSQDPEPGKMGMRSSDSPKESHRDISTSSKLKICKDCGSQVSKRADNCPHCGAPVESMSLKTDRQPQRLVVTPTKSMGVSIILTVLFGPLGMLYSTILGGIIMGVLSLVIALPTFGLGLLITWPICIIWAAVATNLYNEKLLQDKQQQYAGNSAVDSDPATRKEPERSQGNGGKKVNAERVNRETRRSMNQLIGILVCVALVALICLGMLLIKKTSRPPATSQTSTKSATLEEETRRVPTRSDRKGFARVLDANLKDGDFRREWGEELDWRDKWSFAIITQGSEDEILNIGYERMSLGIADHLLRAHLSGFYNHRTVMKEAKELGFEKIVCETGLSEDGSWTWDLINEKYEIRGNVSQREEQR